MPVKDAQVAYTAYWPHSSVHIAKYTAVIFPIFLLFLLPMYYNWMLHKVCGCTLDCVSISFFRVYYSARKQLNAVLPLSHMPCIIEPHDTAWP